MSYSNSDFVKAVEESTSIRQVLVKIGLAPRGGNYRTVTNKAKKLNLDMSHFTGQGWNKGKRHGPKRPIKDYLSNKFKIGSYKLKLRLLAEGYFEHKCYQCGLTKWNSKEIPLELEHKDGNHLNNNLSNLTLLCPNCHAQTSTYRGKNISK